MQFWSNFGQNFVITLLLFVMSYIVIVQHFWLVVVMLFYVNLVVSHIAKIMTDQLVSLIQDLYDVSVTLDDHLRDLERMTEHAVELLRPRPKKKVKEAPTIAPRVAPAPAPTQNIPVVVTREDELRTLLMQVDQLLNRSRQMRGEKELVITETGIFCLIFDEMNHHGNCLTENLGLKPKKEEKVKKMAAPAVEPPPPPPPPEPPINLAFSESFLRQMETYQKLQESMEETKWSNKRLKKFVSRMSGDKKPKADKYSLAEISQKYKKLQEVLNGVPREFPYGMSTCTWVDDVTHRVQPRWACQKFIDNGALVKELWRDILNYYKCTIRVKNRTSQRKIRMRFTSIVVWRRSPYHRLRLQR